jgi:hypothetical protein
MIWRVPLAALLGALLFLLLGWLSYALGLVPADPSVEVPANRLELGQGSAHMSSEGLVIEAAGPKGVTVLGVRLAGLPADHFDRLGWRLQGLTFQQQLAVVWISDSEPGHPRRVAVENDADTDHAVVLADQAGWNGQILWIGLELQGALSSPVVVQGMTIYPSSPGLGWVLERLRSAWTYKEPWSMRSINFRESASSSWSESLIGQVGLWLALSVGCFAALSTRMAWRYRISGAALLALIGWLALDLNWQWQLMWRLDDSRRHYSGVPSEERLRVKEPNASIEKLVDSVRTHVADPASRIFLVSADPSGYAPLRVRYRLLPLNVSPGMRHLPSPNQARAGDFVMLVLPPGGIRYDPDQGRLTDGLSVLSAERVLEVPNAASLFRLLEPEPT